MDQLLPMQMMSEDDIQQLEQVEDQLLHDMQGMRPNHQKSKQNQAMVKQRQSKSKSIEIQGQKQQIEEIKQHEVQIDKHGSKSPISKNNKDVKKSCEQRQPQIGPQQKEQRQLQVEKIQNKSRQLPSLELLIEEQVEKKSQKSTGSCSGSNKSIDKPIDSSLSEEQEPKLINDVEFNPQFKSKVNKNHKQHFNSNEILVKSQQIVQNQKKEVNSIDQDNDDYYDDELDELVMDEEVELQTSDLDRKELMRRPFKIRPQPIRSKFVGIFPPN